MNSRRQWTHVPGSRTLYADAEQAKQTGGMVALFPRSDFADMLTVPGGEPVEDLHCTLVFLGDDLADMPDGGLGADIDSVAANYAEIHAEVFGHAVFNPHGEDPCGVYLVGHSSDLDQIHADVLQAAQADFPDLPNQHVPWMPHITGAYGNPPALGQYAGPIVFDRIGLRMAGQAQDYPLMGSSVVANRRQWVI